MSSPCPTQGISVVLWACRSVYFSYIPVLLYVKFEINCVSNTICMLINNCYTRILKGWVGGGGGRLNEGGGGVVGSDHRDHEATNSLTTPKRVQSALTKCGTFSGFCVPRNALSFHFHFVFDFFESPSQI